jgi:flagellum-specific peptidoglycan hydrolase FlgJ
MTPSDFIHTIAASAQASMRTTHIPASFVVAEGALESGWGTSELTRDACNLFGVKADPSWCGPVLEMRTREFLHGKWVIVPAMWRKYSNWLGCITDHAAFLLDNPRYKPAFQHQDGEGFARAVAAAGYATDPQYASKLIEIINAHGLAALDHA